MGERRGFSYYKAFTTENFRYLKWEPVLLYFCTRSVMGQVDHGPGLQIARTMQAAKSPDLL